MFSDSYQKTTYVWYESSEKDSEDVDVHYLRLYKKRKVLCTNEELQETQN